MQPKMMKPSPMRKPSNVIIFRRNVKTAVMPVAFMLLYAGGRQAHKGSKFSTPNFSAGQGCVILPLPRQSHN